MSTSESTLSIILKARDLASGEVGKLGASMKSLKSGALDSVGLGMIGVAGAAAALTGVLVKGVQGAIEEEASLKRMGAALAANVPGFDGNTAAILKTIKARENLGFSDDALRDSLTKLVPATHDVSKAMDIQRTAMDLARLKGISLEDASQALVKVEAGQYKMLKSLGIVLGEGATQTEALAAVQKVAMGQAAEYADTTAGKMDTLKIKFDDLTETVGGAVVPVLDTLVSSLIKVTDAADPEAEITLTDRIGSLADGIMHLNPLTFGAASALDTMRAKAEAAIPIVDTYSESNANAREPTQTMTTANNKFAASFDRVAESGADALAAVQKEIKYLQDHQEAINEANRLLFGSRGAGTSNTSTYVAPHTTTGHASGGWVGLNGPELSWLGEKGPEYVVPNDQLRASSGPSVTLQGISERDIMDIVDRGLFVRLRRAGTGS